MNIYLFHKEANIFMSILLIQLDACIICEWKPQIEIAWLYSVMGYIRAFNVTKCGVIFVYIKDHKIL